MEEKYPILKNRLQSTFIDSIVIIILLFIATGIIEKYDDIPDWARIMLFVILILGYEPLFMTFGCTLGNYIKGIRVRKNTNVSKRINIIQALIRYPIKFFLGWISFLTIHSDPKSRAIHDIIVGSIMIEL